MFEQQPPIRIDQQPSLGADLVFQRSDPGVLPIPSGTPKPVHPSSLAELKMLATLVDLQADVRLLRREVLALHVLVEQQTWRSRWRHLLAWMRRTFYRWS